jgi:hypothetical protein
MGVVKVGDRDDFRAGECYLIHKSGSLAARDGSAGCEPHCYVQHADK